MIKMKQITISTKITNCENCPKYFYDMEDGDLCILVNPSKRVLKYGRGIPDWCPLEDVKNDGSNGIL